jgi:hypothetical protein
MTITARFKSTCSRCHQPIQQGAQIDYDRANRTATHLDCEPQAIPEPTGDLKRVVDHLIGLEANPDPKQQMSEFERSLLSWFRRHGSLTERQMHAMLNRLDQPVMPGADQVPAGYYALTSPDHGTYFVKVWRGKHNSSYVKTYLVHGDNESPVNTRQTLDEIIAAGPADAARRYGRLIRKCSFCSRRLTNALSRYLCIGPVCGGHHYEESAWGDMKREARNWLLEHGIDPLEDLPEDVDLDALMNKEGITA